MPLQEEEDSQYELEDYIFEMQCQADRSTTTPPHQEEEEKQVDVYTCLAEKESNLVLAAELGKALLHRNEILVQENERLAEEYSRKLEVRVDSFYVYELGLGFQRIWQKKDFSQLRLCPDFYFLSYREKFIENWGSKMAITLSAYPYVEQGKKMWGRHSCEVPGHPFIPFSGYRVNTKHPLVITSEQSERSSY